MYIFLIKLGSYCFVTCFFPSTFSTLLNILQYYFYGQFVFLFYVCNILYLTDRSTLPRGIHCVNSFRCTFSDSFLGKVDFFLVFILFKNILYPNILLCDLPFNLMVYLGYSSMSVNTDFFPKFSSSIQKDIHVLERWNVL